MGRPHRIATLLPAATEMVAALGRLGAIVGRSHECDFPPNVTALPIVTRPRSQALAASDSGGRAIHAALSDLLAEALSLYEVDVGALAALAPDLVVTQAQCAVCAVDLETVAAALAGLGPSRPKLVSLSGTTLTGVLEDIGRVAEAIGAESAGAALCEAMSQRVQGVARRTAGAARYRVACLEWLDPPMGAGNWMPELVALAGGEPLFGVAGQHTPWLEPAELRRADPEAILVVPCGFTLDRAERELEECWPRLGFEALKATRTGRLYLADGNALFNRPGPRLVESLEVLAEILHPERCRYGHEGRFWRRFSPGQRV